MPTITVNGAETGEDSSAVLVLRPGHPWSDIVAGEAVIELLTGRAAAVWRDGTGTTTVTASQVPADERDLENARGILAQRFGQPGRPAYHVTDATVAPAEHEHAAPGGGQVLRHRHPHQGP